MTRGVTALGSRFTRLLAASAVSSLGGGLQLLAFPLLASSLTHDARLIAVLAATSMLPSLVLAVPLGHLVDRAPKGRLMVAADIACAAIVAVLVGVQLGRVLRLWELFVFSVALGTAEVLSAMSSSGYLPRIVAAGDLVRANSHLATVSQLGAGIVGPALGGVAFALRPILPFAANGVSFLVSAALVASFAWRGDRAPSVRRPESRQGRLRGWSAGVAAIRDNRSLQALLVLVACSGLFGWMPEATFVLYARLALHATAGQYGVLLAVTPAGAVLGGVLMGRRRRAGKLLWLVMTTELLYGLLLVPPWFLRSVVAVAAVLFMQGVPLILHGATMRSIRQQLIPQQIWGQTSAVFTMVGSSTDALGLAAGGFVGHSLGLRQVWLLAGLGEVAVALTLLTTRRRILAASEKQDPDRHLAAGR